MKIHSLPSPYTNEQIVQYLRTVNFFTEQALATGEDVEADADALIKSFDPSLENLSKLIRGHLIAFPFENLAMHYSSKRKVEVSSQGTYDRMVAAGKGFGSYCFGQNTLFLGILRGLKYRVYGCGARVNRAHPEDRGPPSLGELYHLALIVQLPSPPDPAVDQLYLADVGFGGIFGVSGLVRPIPLIDGTTVTGSAAPEQHRVITACHPSSAISLSDDVLPKDWMLQANRDPANEEWRTLFHFSLACELFELDVECQSFGVSNQIESPLMSRLICIKVFEVEDHPETLGRVSLIGDRLVRRIGKKTEEVCSFKTESERVEALKEHCGVYLEPEEVQCMRGRLPALPMD